MSEIPSLKQNVERMSSLLSELCERIVAIKEENEHLKVENQRLREELNKKQQ